MDFSVQYLSFFVIQTQGTGPSTERSYKHFQTLDHSDYQESELKQFLDGEFARICKRKVEKHPNTEQAPTKIGLFAVEPGYELTSNPNYNLFQRIRAAETRELFHAFSDELLRMYMDTSAVRGGALIIARAKLDKWFDDPLLFVLKCDFEPKIARISDEKSLIANVEMAISARSIKSIQYPHMPEEGMLEEGELKIHQASHARYFEDFLKYVNYEKTMPEILNEQVTGMVQQYMEEKWHGYQGQDHLEAKEQEEQSLEFWAASEKRDLLPRWSHDQVVEATRQVIEHKSDLELKFKLDDVTVKGQMADYGESIHIARLNGRYAVVIVGEAFEFERGVSPVELLHPNELEEVLERIRLNAERDAQSPSYDAPPAAANASGSSDVPWDD